MHGMGWCALMGACVRAGLGWAGLGVLCMEISHRATSMRALFMQGDDIKKPADYEAISSTAPWLTQLSQKLPHSAKALEQMAALLAACTKLEDVTLHGTWL